VITFDSEPTFAIPDCILAEKTTWCIYNSSYKAERMYPNHKKSVCKNYLEFGYLTDICMASNEAPRCVYCGETHNHFNHEYTAPGCNEKALCQHTELNWNLCRTTGDHHSLDRNCRTYKARNALRPSQSTPPQGTQTMEE